MGIESGIGDRVNSTIEGAPLPCDDEALKEAISNPTLEKCLYEQAPVFWLKAVIAKETGRGASQVTNSELAERYSRGGFVEWDPYIAHAVKQYLISQGFVGF